MQGLYPPLLGVVKLAVQITKQDFGVTGKALRTAEEQKVLFDRGVSKVDGTKSRSNHQAWADGFAHAVDLTPYVSGKGYQVNSPELQLEIAVAMCRAGKELGVRLVWGGNWYEVLTDLEPVAVEMAQAVARYKARRREMGKSAFVDYPHFETWRD